ncbi:MAG TPA: MarR family transcriptional regulator [Methylomirabilota bacterium]|nr:MarR family transcriptional regulator [Methylomirabilota bacterium]
MNANITSRLIELSFQLSRQIKGTMCFTSQFINLSMLQLQALSFIKSKPNVHMREIAEHFHIELPSATSLLNKLHEMQLVSRSTDATDRRVVKISLTADGETLLKDAMIERNKKTEILLSYLSETEKENLLHIFEKLLTKMEEKK